MTLTADQIRAIRAQAPDLAKVGQEIYALLNPKQKTAWKRERISVEIKPDHFYSPREVAAVLSVSYNSAIRIMERMGRTADFAKPRARKRLLRVKGSDLRDYLKDKTK